VLSVPQSSGSEAFDEADLHESSRASRADSKVSLFRFQKTNRKSLIVPSRCSAEQFAVMGNSASFGRSASADCGRYVRRSTLAALRVQRVAARAPPRVRIALIHAAVIGY
jgi:hypothetical protein